MMKVLILTLSTGQGHIQTSKAISEELTSRGAKCAILDLFKYVSPVLSDSVEKGYLLSSRYTPKLYGTIYDGMDNKKHKDGRKSFVTFLNDVISSAKLRAILEDERPDVIISTHVFCATVMTHLKEILPDSVNIGIITDFTIHPLWEETRLDYYVTAHPLLNNQCKKKDIDEGKILPFGIPIEKKFSNKISKQDARKILGIKDMPTLLFMMGSMGYGNIPKIVSCIDEISLDYQLLCVCARNESARKKTMALNLRHDTYVYGFVDNIDVMMDAADMLITKPGGLSMSECLAKELPAIFVKPIPGQENRNLEFFINNGVGAAVSKNYPIDEAVYQMLSNTWKLENAPRGAAYLGRSRAGKELSDFILSLKK